MYDEHTAGSLTRVIEMPSFEKEMEKTRERIARLSRSSGRDVRPTLLHWTWDQIAAKSGPFVLDALTASAVYPSAYTDWYCGMLAGPEPTPTSIGIVLRKLGCVVWRPDRCKLWLLPGRDHDAARLKGGAYWLRRAKNVEHGGDPAWEPDPLYKKHNHALYHDPTERVAALFLDAEAESDSGQGGNPDWLSWR